MTSTAHDLAGDLRRFSVREYHRMIEAGMLDEDEHLELLEGHLVMMSPQGVMHARVVQRLTRVLAAALPPALVLRPQLPMTLSDESEPEPDLAIVTEDEAERVAAHPSTALLVIEVSSGSLARDRTMKAALYAAAGVSEYWIVNLADEQIERHLDPDPSAAHFTRTDIVRPGATLAPRALPAARIDVTTLLA